MRTRGRVYHEPQLSEAERALAQYCPRRCGAFLAEESQTGANGVAASVLFCLNPRCGWREWTVTDKCRDLERLAREGCRPKEIAEHLGLSERTVFRRLAELNAANSP